MSMSYLISVEIYIEDAEWLAAYLASAQNPKARRVREACYDAVITARREIDAETN